MQAQKQTAMRHHEVAMMKCSDSRQLTKTLPAPRVLSSRLVDKGGFPGCPRTHVALTRTVDHMRTGNDVLCEHSSEESTVESAESPK